MFSIIYTLCCYVADCDYVVEKKQITKYYSLLIWQNNSKINLFRANQTMYFDYICTLKKTKISIYG